MQWFVRTVFVLALTSSVLAKKSNYWWMFPNFDENGSNNRENLVANITQGDLRNGTDGQGANLTTIVDGDFNLRSDDNSEDNLDINEGNGRPVFPTEDFDRDNKTQPATGNENVSGTDSDKDLNWPVDKENQTDAKTLMSGDTWENDNETKTEQENPSSFEKMEETELSTDLMNDEDEVVHVEGDAHPSSKLEQEQLNDEQSASSEDDELQEEMAPIDELEQIFEEQDKAVHEDGDAHPSSKIEMEEISNTEEVEDLDFPPEEKDESVHENGDAHPSSKIEVEEISNTEEVEDLDFPPEEKDESVHENGDAHPSSKIEVEEISNTEEVEDLDFPPEEKDESVHEEGDAHPSSKFETEGNNDAEEIQEPNSVDEISLSADDEVPEETNSSSENVNGQDLNSDNNEEINNSSSNESQENNEENPTEENSKLFESSNNEDLDFELSEDVLEKEDEKEAETELRHTQDDEASALVSEGENMDDEDEIQPINNNEPSSIDSDYEDAPLHWIDEELLNKESSTIINKSAGDAIISEGEDTSAVVPIAPVFKTPLCSFDTRPFNLTILPVNSVNEMHGTDVSLLCTLVPHNASETMPHFRLTWLFEKEGCQKDSSNKHACTRVLVSKNYESPDSPNTLSYELNKLNHTIHTGLYICDAEIYGCQSQNQNATETSQALYLKVYIKPNYALHIGIISSVCVILLAILGGLVSYARRVQKQSKNRYQELLSSADIQYYPSKVLELPNSVYNTTTTGFVRMSASTFSSKSSFTSNEDV
ncbi:protein PFC0760c-like [Daphnia carinata]|uniref:protein PFC0760c-like n=1 Tax=Daphnia carinata TaxID=120202 RepID=UPI00257A692B|nr:protein PFC0760c-like [Daphnia carinata]